ncbi:MAG TPA: acetate--CoA ligase family protein [Bradyrhizobium sp.]|jgi:succinyl-CoA synthetase beta subunit
MNQLAPIRGAAVLVPALVPTTTDLEALAGTLVRVSYFAMHMQGHLAELEINPLMVLPSAQGVKAVDALVVFRGT